MKTSWIGSLSEHNLKSKIKNLKFGLVAGAMLLPFSFPADAQQPGKVPKIGFLVVPSRAFFANRIELFQQGLHSLGYVKERTL